MGRFLRTSMLMAVLLGCGPSTPGGRLPGGLDTGPVRQERTLIVAIELEPRSIAALAPTIGGASSTFVIRPFSALLDFIDGSGVPHPYLAEALPQLNTDTWRVSPDGRMETRYRLKPNLRWHDGTPLSAEDFAFAWRVSTTPDAGFGITASPPINLMEEVVAADDQTLVIRWKQLYPEAGVLQSGGSRLGLPPFPRHILKDAYETQRDSFPNHPYWTREFVGLGPYKLDRWELGSFLEGVPFDGHVGGRPKIDRIRMVFIGDGNTVMANMKAGTVHVAADSLGFQQALELKREWAPTGAGSLIVTATSLRNVLFQFRPGIGDPRALQDVRVRRALAHAVDKQVINEAMWGGEIVMIDTLFDPRATHYPAIDRAIVKYPFDLRASERLMNEAGFTRGPEGAYTSGAEGRFTPELKSSEGTSERAVLASSWRQAGFDVQEAVLPRALAQDPESRSSFPGMYINATGADENNQTAALLSSQIGTPNNRWRGGNRGGWSSSEYDQLVSLFNETLNPDERIQQRARMARLMSEDLPTIQLSFNPNPTAFVTAVVGPVSGTLGTTGLTAWNITDWELR